MNNGLLLFLTLFLFPSEIEGAAIYEDESSVRLDTDGDKVNNWKLEEEWFKYVADTSELEGAVDDDWYGTIDFDKWRELVPISEGIWALFYQRPPSFEIQPPSFSYAPRGISGTPYATVHVTYFMYGECFFNVTVGKEQKVRSSILNDCGEDCGFEFQRITVDLATKGQNSYDTFGIVLNTTAPGSFILIDIIEADEYQPPPATTTIAPSWDSTLDTSIDLQDGWSITTELTEYRNEAEGFSDIVQKPPYTNIIFKEWDLLEPESVGIWASFYPDDPSKEIPGITYKWSGSRHQQLRAVYYLHGNSSISFVVGGLNVLDVWNDCGLDCEYEFRNVTVDLVDGPETPGVEHFVIELLTWEPGSFVLIDMIEAFEYLPTSSPTSFTADPIPTLCPYYPETSLSSELTSSTSESDEDSTDDIPTTTESCECYPCDEVLDTEDDLEESEVGFKWTVSSSFEYFNTSYDIQEAMEGDLPLDFNYTSFGDANGIWVLYNDGASAKPAILPSIVFEDDVVYDILRVTYYLYGSDSSLLVYMGDEEPRELPNNLEESWQLFYWEPFGNLKFRIEANLDDNEGSFAFIDQVTTSLRDCPIAAPSNSLTSSRNEICICGPTPSPCPSPPTTIKVSTTTKTVPTTTTTKRTTRPPATTTIQSSSASSSAPASDTTPEPDDKMSTSMRQEPTTAPGSPAAPSTTEDNGALFRQESFIAPIVLPIIIFLLL